MAEFTPKQIRDNCALGAKCGCTAEARPWDCSNWGRSSLAAPPIVQSKEERLRTTRKTWERRRDNMMRAAERRIGKLKPDSEIESKLYDVRRNPEKHLRKKGVTMRGMRS